jgi:hypothetical protein
MNSNKHIVIDGVLIGREHWDVPVRVELRAFLRFSRRMDSQLRRLVVRWAYSASPCARGVPLMRVQADVSVPPAS